MADNSQKEEFQGDVLAYPKRISVQPLFRKFSTPQLLAQTGANLRSKSSLSRESFNAIRNEAYEIASARPSRYATRTSYGEHYTWRGALHPSFSGKLPCDESRRNRPHPNEQATLNTHNQKSNFLLVVTSAYKINYNLFRKKSAHNFIYSTNTCIRNLCTNNVFTITLEHNIFKIF